MPCSRSSAIKRILSLYAERIAADPDYHLQIGADDLMTDANVEAICALDLFPEYERGKTADVQTYDRDVQLLQAWLSSREGTLQ